MAHYVGISLFVLCPVIALFGIIVFSIRKQAREVRDFFDGWESGDEVIKRGGWKYTFLRMVEGSILLENQSTKALVLIPIEEAVRFLSNPRMNAKRKAIKNENEQAHLRSLLNTP